MDIVSLLYELIKNFMFGESTLEVWQEQFLVLGTTLFAFFLLVVFIRETIDFVYSFFRRL